MTIVAEKPQTTVTLDSYTLNAVIQIVLTGNTALQSELLAAAAGGSSNANLVANLLYIAGYPPDRCMPIDDGVSLLASLFNVTSTHPPVYPTLHATDFAQQLLLALPEDTLIAVTKSATGSVKEGSYFAVKRLMGSGHLSVILRLGRMALYWMKTHGDLGTFLKLLDSGVENAALAAWYALPVAERHEWSVFIEKTVAPIGCKEIFAPNGRIINSLIVLSPRAALTALCSWPNKPFIKADDGTAERTLYSEHTPVEHIIDGKHYTFPGYRVRYLPYSGPLFQESECELGILTCKALSACLRYHRLMLHVSVQKAADYLPTASNNHYLTKSIYLTRWRALSFAVSQQSDSTTRNYVRHNSWWDRSVAELEQMPPMPLNNLFIDAFHTYTSSKSQPKSLYDSVLDNMYECAKEQGTVIDRVRMKVTGLCSGETPANCMSLSTYMPQMLDEDSYVSYLSTLNTHWRSLGRGWLCDVVRNDVIHILLNHMSSRDWIIHNDHVTLQLLAHPRK